MNQEKKLGLLSRIKNIFIFEGEVVNILEFGIDPNTFMSDTIITIADQSSGQYRDFIGYTTHIEAMNIHKGDIVSVGFLGIRKKQG